MTHDRRTWYYPRSEATRTRFHRSIDVPQGRPNRPPIEVACFPDNSPARRSFHRASRDRERTYGITSRNCYIEYIYKYIYIYIRRGTGDVRSVDVTVLWRFILASVPENRIDLPIANAISSLLNVSKPISMLYRIR